MKNFVVLAMVLWGASLGAPAADVIWRDPGPMASLDLRHGAGGSVHAPKPAETFRFISEDHEATSPKFVVADGQGVVWKVKLGDEPQSETAASRLVWAAGYFVDEDYYLAELTVTDLPTLKRGREFVSAAGRVHNARLERSMPNAKKAGNWGWFVNPFTGTRELNGLRIMMALVNNWDLKEVNNTILEIDGERRHMVADLGATFGSTGNNLTRSKSAPQEYAESEFVETVTAETVDFALHSRPFFLTAVYLANYQMRTKMESVANEIPIADARWLGRRLAMLSQGQIQDAFHAAGYKPDEVAVYALTVRRRIAALAAL